MILFHFSAIMVSLVVGCGQDFCGSGELQSAVWKNLIYK